MDNRWIRIPTWNFAFSRNPKIPRKGMCRYVDDDLYPQGLLDRWQASVYAGFVWKEQAYHETMVK